MAKSEHHKKETSTTRWDEGVFEQLKQLSEHFSNSQNGMVNYCIKEIHRQTFND